jgi:hypothetical protein
MSYPIRNLIMIMMFSFFWACSESKFDLPQQEAFFDTGVQYNKKVDLLFMIDNSSSMLQYQKKLERQIPYLLESLNAKELDYRIASVSSDMRRSGSGGRLLGQPSFLTPQTEGLEALLRARLVLGQTGSDIESGLASIWGALETPLGKSFLRQDALLSIIVLTNEDDYSPHPVSHYQDFLDSVKSEVPGFDQGWILNFIGVTDIQGSCRTTGDFKEAGLRYIELADISGGIKTSICEADLVEAVSILEKKIVQILSDYKLDQIPRFETIEVYINEMLVPHHEVHGWFYVESQNLIRFNGDFLPKASDRIRVEYKPLSGS